MIYARTEFGPAPAFIIGAVAVTTVIMNLILPIPLWETALTLAVLVFVLAFCWLTVRVDSQAIVCSFAFGLFRRTIALDRIVTVELSDKMPFSMGLRLGRGTIYYTLGDRRGVAIALDNNRRVVIATDQPGALHRAIERALQVRNVTPSSV